MLSVHQVLCKSASHESCQQDGKLGSFLCIFIPPLKSHPNNYGLTEITLYELRKPVKDLQQPSEYPEKKPHLNVEKLDDPLIQLCLTPSLVELATSGPNFDLLPGSGRSKLKHQKHQQSPPLGPLNLAFELACAAILISTVGMANRSPCETPGTQHSSLSIPDTSGGNAGGTFWCRGLKLS